MGLKEYLEHISHANGMIVRESCPYIKMREPL